MALFDVQFHSDVVEGVHPASLGQLFLTVRGSVSGNFGGGEDIADDCAVLFNAFDVAPLSGRRSILVSLSPYGRAALTQASLEEYGNRVVPADKLLGNEVSRLNDDISHRRLSHESAAEQCCIEVAGWISQRLSPIPAAHEEIIDQTLAWVG
ncbi:hypothetical protein [Erythrobacter sp. Alg231-14]|uniref:hypothetical protein n=1 Tax=Erythrobacter sp. Alg231-14 TaxID=1922225 RepID=UPI000D54AEC3